MRIALKINIFTCGSVRATWIHRQIYAIMWNFPLTIPEVDNAIHTLLFVKSFQDNNLAGRRKRLSGA